MGQREGNGLAYRRPRAAHLQRPFRSEMALKFSKLPQAALPAPCSLPGFALIPANPSPVPQESRGLRGPPLHPHPLQFNWTARQETANHQGTPALTDICKIPTNPTTKTQRRLRDGPSALREAMSPSERGTSGGSSAKAVRLHVCGNQIKGRRAFLKPGFSFRSGNDILGPALLQSGESHPKLARSQ